MGIIAVSALFALIVLQIARFVGSIVSLFFGSKRTWLWVALAAYNYASRALGVALYRETDGIRYIAAILAGVAAAIVAVMLARRFPKAVLAVGGFLAGGLIFIQLLGPLLNPAPDWLVIGILVGAGMLAGYWAVRNAEMTGIVLSALVGAGMLSSLLVELMGFEEAVRFQVYIVLALIGIGFQTWRERRADRVVMAGQEGA
jgi:hypothetical protein